MNVIVVPNGGEYHYFRPDTTIEKESKDFYCPENITTLSANIVLYIKVCRAGKAISKKFAQRYYNSFGAGILLYAEELINPDLPGTFSMATSLDYSTILSKELGNIAELAATTEPISISYGSTESPIAKHLSIPEGVIDFIESKIESISQNSSLRVGDTIAFELCQKGIKLQRGNQIKLFLGDQLLLDFSIC